MNKLLLSLSGAIATKRSTIKQLRGPIVGDGDCVNSGAAITRLKEGPANIPEIVHLGEPYTDTDFTTPDALFWDGYESGSDELAWDIGLADGTYSWARWSTVTGFATHTLFDSGKAVSYTEPI